MVGAWLVWGGPQAAYAQVAPGPPVATVQAEAMPEKSVRRAFGLSLLMPGLGHRYADGGRWSRTASLHLGSEVGLWLSLAGLAWRRDHLVQSYETLAATRAGADLAGKDRQFFINLATYRSSQDYLDEQLRARAWDQIDYVSDASFQWAWASEEDFEAFRDRRDAAESTSRRRTLVITLLVANRFAAALTSIRAVNKANEALHTAGLHLRADPPPRYGRWPMLSLTWTP